MQEHVQETERAQEGGVPPLPETESDDLGAAMINEDQTAEGSPEADESEGEMSESDSEEKEQGEEESH